MKKKRKIPKKRLFRRWWWSWMGGFCGVLSRRGVSWCFEGASLSKVSLRAPFWPMVLWWPPLQSTWKCHPGVPCLLPLRWLLSSFVKSFWIVRTECFFDEMGFEGEGSSMEEKGGLVEEEAGLVELLGVCSDMTWGSIRCPHILPLGFFSSFTKGLQSEEFSPKIWNFDNSSKSFWVK